MDRQPPNAKRTLATVTSVGDVAGISHVPGAGLGGREWGAGCSPTAPGRCLHFECRAGSCPCLPGVEMRGSPPLPHHFVCVETFTLPYLTLGPGTDGDRLLVISDKSKQVLLMRPDGTLVGPPLALSVPTKSKPEGISILPLEAGR